jgi:uncharacterized protein
MATVSHADVFLHAVRAGDAAAVERMLAAEPELAHAKNEQGQSAILVATYNGRKEIRDLLLDAGVELELHEAAAAGDLARVKQYVDDRTDLAKSYSPDGFAVVALAATFGHLPVAQYLRGQGADINAAATNATGYNALTGAVASGHTAIVAWLLENGADANYRYGSGYSPLLTAAANGHTRILELLLDRGADLQAKTNDGKTALQFAEERKHPEAAEFLRSRGAT